MHCFACGDNDGVCCGGGEIKMKENICFNSLAMCN